MKALGPARLGSEEGFWPISQVLLDVRQLGDVLAVRDKRGMRGE